MSDWNPDSSPSGLMATDYALFLWKRRWWVLGLTFAALVLTYLGVRFFHSNQYEARAQIMVRQQPRVTNVESDEPGIHPPSFRMMFMADGNIRFVVNQYNEMHEAGRWSDDPGARLIKTPLEKLRPMFRAEAATSVDTTVNTEFSPVIELRTRGFTPGMARTLMDLWMSRILDEYGNLLTEEAVYVAQAAQARLGDLRTEYSQAGMEAERLDQKLAGLDTQAAGLRRTLTSAVVPTRRPPLGNEVLALGTFSGPRETNLTIQGSAGGDQPGLIEQRNAVRVQLNVMRTVGGDNSDVEMLGAQLEQLEAEINAVEMELDMIGEEAAEVAARRSNNAVEINRLESAIRLVASQASQAEALNRRLESDAEGWAPEKYSTLRVLAEPAVPNERIWPKRTLIAGGVAFGVLILLILAFCAELYIRRSIVLAEDRKGIAG